MRLCSIVDSYPLQDMAQDSGRKISLDEAIDLSIKNSKPLRAAQARIEQAAANTTISKQNQLPDLKVSGSYLRLTQPNIDMQYKTNSGGTRGEPIKVNQAAYGIANLSSSCLFRYENSIRNPFF